MNITLPEDQMRQIVTKAILEGLGEEQKTLIMTAAVEHLLGQPEERNHYSQDKRNRLQRIFDDAAERAMLVVAREEFTKPEWADKLRVLMGPIVEKLLSDPNAYKAREVIAAALVEALNKTRDS